MNIRRKNSGFTLIELLIVITIIGVLATIGTLSYANIIKRARIAKAQSDMTDLKKALARLEIVSDQLPSHYPASTCIANNEANMNACNAGLVCTDGDFPRWDGPYVDVNDTLDQWGNAYYFDPDYHCHSYVPGCEDVANHSTVQVLQSHGPDGVQGYTDGDGRDADNIVLILCP